MATSRGSTWIETGDTYRTGDAAGTPYVTIEGEPGSGDLSLFFAGDRATDSSRVECIDAMIAALQQLRANTLRRMAPAQPHPAGDGAEVPHRSIVNPRGMALHLIADHHVDENLADLLGVTGLALEKRHRVEHLNAGDTVYADLPAIDPDEPETPEHDPGPEVDDEGGMSEYRYITAD